MLRLAELIGRLPRKIQFSIESRIDLLRPETLRRSAEVGLTSITVGIETPDEDTLRQYNRAPIKRRPAARVRRRSAAGWASAPWPAS